MTTTEYRDPTPIDPNKDYTIEELADFIRHKMRGKDVREALARLVEKKWGLLPGSINTDALGTDAVTLDKLNESLFKPYSRIDFTSTGSLKLINIQYDVTQLTEIGDKLKVNFSVLTESTNINYLRAELTEENGTEHDFGVETINGKTGTLVFAKEISASGINLKGAKLTARVGVLDNTKAFSYHLSIPELLSGDKYQAVYLSGLMHFNDVKASIDVNPGGLLVGTTELNRLLNSKFVNLKNLNYPVIEKWDYWEHVEKATSVANSAQLWLVADISKIDLTNATIEHNAGIYSESKNFSGIGSAIFVNDSKTDITATTGNSKTFAVANKVVDGYQYWLQKIVNGKNVNFSNGKYFHILLRGSLTDINELTDLYYRDVRLRINGVPIPLEYNGPITIGGETPIQAVVKNHIMPSTLISRQMLDELLSGPTFKDYSKGNIYFKVKVNQNFANVEGTKNEMQDSETLADVNCALRLPPSYTKTGEPTKLVLWAHGSGSLITENSASELDAAAAHLLSAGYALFDANGSNNDYLEHADHMSSPRAISAYKKAYDYVVKNYNVDPLIYVHGHSMGGLLALNFANKFSGIVRCLALVHPVMDLKGQAWDHPWFGTTRKQLAVEHNFNDKTGATFEADKLTGYDPINTTALLSGDKRLIFNKLPIKIWHGTADTTVDISGSINYINGVKAAGGQAELRTVEGVAHTIVPVIFEEIKLFLRRY